jgi:HSP20 family protein
MSRDWRNHWLGQSIFEDIDREFAEVEDLLSRMFKTVRDTGPSTTASAANSPYYYGYQITIGSDGRPKIREFGNVKSRAKGLVEQSGVRQPFADTVLDEKENTLRITAEMPGVNKEDIKISINDGYVSILSERGDKKYDANIPVSVNLEESSAKAAYSNGILDLKIKLKETSKTKVKEIKVE